MKLQIEAPTHLIDVNGLALDKIEATPEGGLRIGALVRNTDLAADPRVRRDYGLLSRALLAGASGQLRNKATTAGNLLQRTRCPYFYDTNQPCNKRQPGSGCSAIGGFSRQHAVVGVERRLHRHPSQRHGRGHARARRHGGDGEGRRLDAAASRSRSSTGCPATRRSIETALEPGELITAVTLPKPVGGKHLYHKVRDRASYAFALVSVAAIVQPDGTGRVALGGVAHKPWRVEAAEAELPRGAEAVTARLLADARPTEQNAFKLPLVRAHAGRRAGRSEELSHEVRHARHDQSDRPAQGGRPARRPHRRPATRRRAPRPMPTTATMSCRTRPMATSSARPSPRAASPRSTSPPPRPRPACSPS